MCEGGHLNYAVWRTRLCYKTGHFPLGYLVMGKNVFSQINDMFIQKEVTTLFRSSAASKFGRKNESEQERETESGRKERERERHIERERERKECSFFSFCFTKGQKKRPEYTLCSSFVWSLAYAFNEVKKAQKKLPFTLWPTRIALYPNNHDLTNPGQPVSNCIKSTPPILQHHSPTSKWAQLCQLSRLSPPSTYFGAFTYSLHFNIKSLYVLHSLQIVPLIFSRNNNNDRLAKICVGPCCKLHLILKTTAS